MNIESRTESTIAYPSLITCAGNRNQEICVSIFLWHSIPKGINNSLERLIVIHDATNCHCRDFADQSFDPISG